MNTVLSRLTRLDLPVIAAPLFLVTTAALVEACCRNGVVGTFPSHNARNVQEFEQVLARLGEVQNAEGAAPFAVNLALRSRDTQRFEADLDAIVRHRVALVITNNGDPRAVAQKVHAYGGVVLHDVTTERHARKAIDSGVDGLVLVCAGAGGHGGRNTPFAFVPEVRSFFDGFVVVGGGIATGAAVHAARVLGADMAYVGTPFIATEEAGASPAYVQMLLDASIDDIVYTAAVTGLPANFMADSLRRAGLDAIPPQGFPSSGTPHLPEGVKAWRDVWSAGQGAGRVRKVVPAAERIAVLRDEYQRAGRASFLHPLRQRIMSIDFDIAGHVATLTFNRPQRRNAIDAQAREQLAARIDQVSRDEDVRALILTGAGGAFCAGGDLDGLRTLSGEPAEATRRRLQESHVWFSQLVELDKPVIAAVDGPAYGAGFSLVLAADMVLATLAARFSMAFVRLGFVPDCAAAYLLPRAVGLPRAKELIFSGREVDAREAKALGIVMELHEPQDLLPRARDVAGSFVNASASGLGMSKRMLNRSFETDLRASLEMESVAQGVAVSSDYARDAVQRALGGEPSRFRWPKGR